MPVTSFRGTLPATSLCSAAAARSHGAGAPKPSTTVIVMADDRWTQRLEYVNAAGRINRAYAQRHGYRFRAFALDKAVCGSLHPSPCKLLAVREALADTHVETVVFADSDAIFLDQSLSVSRFLQTHGVSATTPLAMPTDCDHFVLNAGLQIWNKGAGTARLLSEWMARSRNYSLFPWEQEAMKRWYRGQHTWLRRERAVQLIPHNESSWHVGSCDGAAYVPARWLSHVTGRWPQMRAPIMNATLQRLGLEPWGTLCDCAVRLRPPLGTNVASTALGSAAQATPTVAIATPPAATVAGGGGST